MDRLKLLREPAAVVALVGLALHVGLTLAFFLLAPEFAELPLVDLALSLGSPVLVVLLAVLVATCWLAQATPRVRGLTVLSLVLTAGLLVAAIGLFVAGLVQGRVDVQAGLLSVFRGFVPWLTTAVIAVGVFVTLLQRTSVAVTPAVTDVVEPPQPIGTPAADPQLQPGWSPDTAVGAVWRRAGDAASGAPSDQWDAMAQTTGRWGPPPIETSPAASSDQPADPPGAASAGAEWPDLRGDWSPPGRS